MISILIVEDNDMNREMIKRRLEFHGFQTLMANNGQEGIDKAIESQPDLILMDMSLPIVDGWKATAEIKLNDKTKNIPVIGLSAYAGKDDIQKGLNAGCDAYEVKPIDFDHLLITIDKLTA